MTITDHLQPGLRAKIRKTGAISFHVSYNFPVGEDDSESGSSESRPFLLVGHFPQTSVKLARERAKTIRALAERGVNPKKGLHDRLLREIDEQGTRWRP